MVSLIGEINLFLSPFVPESLVCETESAVPSGVTPLIIHTRGLNLVPTHGFLPDR